MQLAAVVLCAAAGAVACGPPVPSTPLERAAFDGDVPRLSALLATQGVHGGGRSSPLVWAARAGQLQAIRVLLDHGADPDRRDGRNGWTPLMHALHTHHGAAARLLVERGADPRVGSSGFSPVEMAALDDDAELVARFAAARPPRAQLERALDIAVRGGALVDIDRSLVGSCRTAAVRALLAADPSLQVDPADGFLSSLWWARRQGCEQTIALVASRSRSARR